MTIAFPRTAAAAALLTLALSAGCGGSGRTPSPPTTPTPPTPPPATPTNTWSAAGQITAVGSGQGVGGATLTPGWSLPPVTAYARGFYERGPVAKPPSTP